jgi:hypothetical protein
MVTGATPLVRAALLAACCAAMAGCASVGEALRMDAPGVVRPGGPSAPAAQAAVVIGQSTKAEVKAALGEAAVVPFDSGFEVWVYRWPGTQGTLRAATELVILFAPSGVAKKTRIRPGYGPGAEVTSSAHRPLTSVMDAKGGASMLAGEWRPSALLEMTHGRRNQTQDPEAAG